MHSDNKKPRFISTLIPLIVLITGIIGCEDNPTELEDYEPQAVLTAFIFNGLPAGDISLIRVQPLYGFYDEDQVGIPDAEIILFPVNPDAEPGDTIFYQYQAPDGTYSPLNPDTIRGKYTYRIEATIPTTEEFLWAETIVPDTFTLTVSHPSTDTLVLQNNPVVIDTFGTFNRTMPPILFQWTSPDSCGGYIGNNICLTPVDSLEGLDPGWDPEDLQDIEEPGRISIDFYLFFQEYQEYPWISFQWVGWHRYEFLAVDKDYFDYLFSYFRVQQGVLDEPQYNINGGLGIFAGCSKTEFMLYMEKAEL